MIQLVVKAKSIVLMLLMTRYSLPVLICRQVKIVEEVAKSIFASEVPAPEDPIVLVKFHFISLKSSD